LAAVVDVHGLCKKIAGSTQNNKNFTRYKHSSFFRLCELLSETFTGNYIGRVWVEAVITSKYSDGESTGW
jgi:hypothetical protein